MPQKVAPTMTNGAKPTLTMAAVDAHRGRRINGTKPTLTTAVSGRLQSMMSNGTKPTLTVAVSGKHQSVMSSPSPAVLARRKQSLLDIIDTQKVSSDHQKMADAPWYILRPTSKFASYWDMVTTLALVFTALVTPFEVAFLPPAETLDDGLFWVNRIVDLVFIFDMTFQFCMMYPVRTDGGSGTSWEYRLKFIALHYAKTWLVPDFASIFPSVFDIEPVARAYIHGADDGGAPREVRIMRIVRVTRLLKLLRLVRSSRLVTRWRTRISMTLSTMTVIQLAVGGLIVCHWVACTLALQAVLSANRLHSWYGAFGWCTYGGEVSNVAAPEEHPVFVDEGVCAAVGALYLVSLHWAFGIMSGFFSDPHEGPFSGDQWPVIDRPVDLGGERFSTGEMFVNLVLLVFGALMWAYVTAKIVDIIVNANPDGTAFKNRMDDLNRFISFYDMPGETAQRCREYFYETRYARAAEARRAIVSELSGDMQETVSELINARWLNSVSFFRGMTSPDGDVLVKPVQRSFLAKVATMLSTDVFIPMERPPSGRLYVIHKGSARFKGLVRSEGFSWGALDVMLPNAPLVKRATAVTYLHVLWVDGPTLRDLAKRFPQSDRSLRQWTLFNGVKEYMLDNLRRASDEERRAAREGVPYTPSGQGSPNPRQSMMGEPNQRPDEAPKTIEELHGQLLTLFKGVDARFEALERLVGGREAEWPRLPPRAPPPPPSLPPIAPRTIRSAPAPPVPRPPPRGGPLEPIPLPQPPAPRRLSSIGGAKRSE